MADISVGFPMRHAVGGEWPLCAVCCAPVRKMERWEDVERNVTVFTVWCHGDKQEVELSHKSVANATSLNVGRAFEWQAAIKREAE